MLIDCDTCTVRGTGCADCVVTVLLGAPPGWQGTDPVVVPMTGRARGGSAAPAAEDVVAIRPGERIVAAAAFERHFTDERTGDDRVEDAQVVEARVAARP